MKIGKKGMDWILVLFEVKVLELEDLWFFMGIYVVEDGLLFWFLNKKFILIFNSYWNYILFIVNILVYVDLKILNKNLEWVFFS